MCPTHWFSMCNHFQPIAVQPIMQMVFLLSKVYIFMSWRSFNEAVAQRQTNEVPPNVLQQCDTELCKGARSTLLWPVVLCRNLYFGSWKIKFSWDKSRLHSCTFPEGVELVGQLEEKETRMVMQRVLFLPGQGRLVTLSGPEQVRFPRHGVWCISFFWNLK